MKATETVEILAGRIRSSNILGRSDGLKKLFEFLVERSGDAATPKEAEVAQAIFGPAVNFDASQDASVRVSVHRLRQKLDEYYKGPGRAEEERLSIPRGAGYRIIVEPNVQAAQSSETAIKPGYGRKAWAIAGFAAFLIGLNIALWAWFAQPSSRDAYAAVRAQAPWADILKDSRPITLVLGDYYIFGEIKAGGRDSRLIREYNINSPSDLDTFLMENPDLISRYMDLGLHYLPTSTGSALKSIMPILASADRDRVRVVQTSDLTPDMIKRTNIVYVGYLSGLGLLREPVFAGSRFSIGGTYDELIDNESKQHYYGEEGGPGPSNKRLRDFGYFSTFKGPNGNHFVIIAGTRDIAVMQTAEAAADADTLEVHAEKAKGAEAFEALYEAEGIQRTNMAGHLLLVSPLKSDKIWNTPPNTMKFPDG